MFRRLRRVLRKVAGVLHREDEVENIILLVYTSFLIHHISMVAIQSKLLALVALCMLAASTAIERVSI